MSVDELGENPEEAAATIRTRAERPLVYPITRDEALWLCDRLDERARELRWARKRTEQAERERDYWSALYDADVTEERERVEQGEAREAKLREAAIAYRRKHSQVTIFDAVERDALDAALAAHPDGGEA